MKPGKVAARLTVALVASVGVIGCMSLAGLPTNPLVSSASTPTRPHPMQAAYRPGPTIPDTRTAAAPTEIPIVPLPVIPGTGPTGARLDRPSHIVTDAPSPVRAEAPPSEPQSAPTAGANVRPMVRAEASPAALVSGTGATPAVRTEPPPAPTSGTGAAPAVRTEAPPPAPMAGAATQPSRTAQRALPADGLLAIRQLQTRAVQRYAGMDSYIVRLMRREQVRGKDSPEDIILFKFRKEPCSIYFKWIGPSSNGREVIYCKGRYDDKIHTLLAAGDNILIAAGTRMAFSVDNPLVRSSSRHSITEAGIGASINRLGNVLEAVSHGDSTRGTLNYLGLLTRPEFPDPVPVVEHVIPPGVEALLPRGGRRIYVFEPQSQLPLLVSARDDTGHEVEYYLYDRLQCPVGLDNDDFNPDKVWKKK